ncbi:MAG: hypothetical protein HY319_30015 [Armatimonadetes bacterium]|nr:hypothetical protein [Armatimonadota bacterium]
MSRVYAIAVMMMLGMFGWFQWTGWGLPNSHMKPDPNIRSAPAYSSGSSHRVGGGGGGYYYTGK